MQPLGDVIRDYQFSEPPEVEAIKTFVHQKFGHTPSVSLHASHIVISVKSSALAGSLRMHLHELTELCQTDKRLVLRISN